MEEPNIFRYLEYRKFLMARFAYLGSRDPGFSLRKFARHPELRLSSSSFVSAVLKGRKNLSQSLRLRFGRALGLRPAEQDYFEALVQANQCRTEDERAHFESRLARFHGIRPRALADAESRFFSRWWYAAAWHWIGAHPELSRPARLAKAIRPAMTTAQAEEAVRVLLELGLIRKLANGFEAAEARLAAGPGFRGEAARTRVRDHFRLAADALDRVPMDARDYPLATLRLSARARGRLKEKIEALWAEARELAGDGTPGERVYAMGLQLFPLSEEAPPSSSRSGKAGGRSGAAAEIANPPL